MSENDYIAEYVRERRPEILSSVDFIIWKMGRIISTAARGIVKAFESVDTETLQKAAAEMGTGPEFETDPDPEEESEENGENETEN